MNWNSPQTAPHAPHTRESQGAARIDLKTGQVQSLKSNELVESRDQWPVCVAKYISSCVGGLKEAVAVFSPAI